MNSNADPTHPSDEVLSDLAMDLLPSSQSRFALDHMATCPECEMRFQRIAADWVSSAARASEHSSRPVQDNAARATEIRSLADILRRPATRWMIGVAAAAVAALILIPTWTGGPGAPLPTKLPPLTQDVLPRSVPPGDQNETLLRGLDAYARDDFVAAIDALREVEATGPIDALRRLYLASAFVHEGDCIEAIRALEGVRIDLVPDPWSAESQWTQYVALVQCGRKAEAEEVLRELAKHPGEPGERARAVIGR